MVLFRQNRSKGPGHRVQNLATIAQGPLHSFDDGVSLKGLPSKAAPIIRHLTPVPDICHLCTDSRPISRKGRLRQFEPSGPKPGSSRLEVIAKARVRGRQRGQNCIVKLRQLLTQHWLTFAALLIDVSFKIRRTSHWSP